MKTLRIPVAEARKNLARVLKTSQNGTRIKLTRYNKTLVAVVPKTDLTDLADCEELRAKRASPARRRRPRRASSK